MTEKMRLIYKTIKCVKYSRVLIIIYFIWSLCIMVTPMHFLI